MDDGPEFKLERAESLASEVDFRDVPGLRMTLGSDDLKPKPLCRGDMKFFPGAKIEAKDFSEKWYSARVVETDWVEREVLIHFDKWSSRFDEWIPMDSSRLRILQTQSRESKGRDFAVGEKILATWADGRKYPAKVNSVLGNDRYDVLFDDGYAKIIRSSKMTKLSEASAKPIVSEDYIGSKQERRDRKRKHSVMELFQTHVRRRSKPDADGVSKKYEQRVPGVDGLDIDLEDTVLGTRYDSGPEGVRAFENIKARAKVYPKKRKKENSKTETDNEEDVGPEWIDGEPKGTESYIVDGNDGPRRSIIVPDKRLPPGWQKHFTQRRTGTSAGKWDVLFIHKSSGKKFRSRNDIRAFMEHQGNFDFEPEKFDFCIHRKKGGKGTRLRHEVTVDAPKKIKTLLPKTKLASPVSENSIPGTPSPAIGRTASEGNVDSAGVFIGGLRVEMEDSCYKCPKEGCTKNFRKENLLQMHIKHYHPEYSKFLGSTPNVADLAYARTIGESIGDIVPKKPSNFLEKINQFEKKKAAQEKQHSPAPAVDLETTRIEKHVSEPEDDSKTKFSSPASSRSIDEEEPAGRLRENNCAMSPGTLFDMRTKEDKPPGGIKTLLPVRPATLETPKTDGPKFSEETNTYSEKGKALRKRQSSDHSSDVTKSKRRQGATDSAEDRPDADALAVDVEVPAVSSYRFSRRKSDPKSDENSQSKSDGVRMMMINGEMVKVEQLRREEIINCTCGFMEEDGLMIQCDLCLCWQHGHCNAIEREKDVPEKYVCYICRHPYRQRHSKKYFHDQDWIKEGKLPSLPNRTKNESLIGRRAAMLKRSYDLVAALLQIRQILHGLRLKINVAQRKDHPKLYLWAKNWEKEEVPKPQTEPVPVMKTVKAPSDPVDPPSESSNSNESKTVLKKVVQQDPDANSIASDSELMKILEEDSAQSEETKPKKEDCSVDGQILLGALTRSDLAGKKLLHDVKIESNESTEDQPLTSDALGDDLMPTVSTKLEGNGEGSPSLSDVCEPKSILLPPIVPEPEAPIDPSECRLRLLEHIEHFQNHIDSRLTTIEAQMDALEAMDPDHLSLNLDVQPRTKQTVQMLLKDLNTVRRLAALC
ncbi:PHD finger protein 20-like protein 1 isoform X2 [Orussus abietinus]|uniref:PHD finger protein 20-like protein 1 isoform X2 n=1 Tax=Orussus abietinus TaxID=222816 RepID=UPI000C715D35|nr:PHD finger protein 20-like protein 1 isoform X2 [Orussus abietinus]